MIDINKINIIILNGGKSRRMGFDKTQIEYQGMSFLEHTISALPSENINLIIGSKATVRRSNKILFLEDSEPNKGPLGGILTGLKKSTSDWNFVISSDAPFCDFPYVLYNLASNLQQEDQMIYGLDGNQKHYLFGLYNKSLIPVIENQLSSEDLSLKTLANTCGRSISITQENFSNFNTKEDLIQHGFKVITLKSFGSIENIIGLPQKVLISKANTTQELNDELRSNYPDLADQKYVIAINQEIVRSNDTLPPICEMALLPPFAGG